MDDGTTKWIGLDCKAQLSLSFFFAKQVHLFGGLSNLFASVPHGLLHSTVTQTILLASIAWSRSLCVTRSLTKDKNGGVAVSYPSFSENDRSNAHCKGSQQQSSLGRYLSVCSSFRIDEP